MQVGDTITGGANNGQPVKPWIETTEGQPSFVRADFFSQIANHLIGLLQGSESDSKLRRINDGALEGNSAGLYYQRYMILNQRMNKGSGELYQVTNLERSSVVLDQNKTNLQDRLQILRIDIDALPIRDMQKMVFINNKFIDQIKYDIVRKTIGDNCLLTCGKCLVKAACPFYNEQEVILTMLNSEKTLSIYLKDNKLDLVHKIIHPDWGKQEMKSYREKHYPYAEIDSGNVRLIDDLVEDIEGIQQIFTETIDGVVTPYDDMGWITKGRYGNLNLRDKNSLERNSYLYNALFIADEETSFKYGAGRQLKVGEYTIKFREANAIKAFSDNDEIFLVCDDAYDPIYLGKLKDLDLDIQNPQVTKHYGQACLNLLDIESPNQAWAETYSNYVHTEGTVASEHETHVGRLRSRSRKTELIGDGSFTEASVLAGKPITRNYIDFIREVKIPMDNIKWALSGKAEDIVKAKKSLPFFETNIRIANVQK